MNIPRLTRAEAAFVIGVPLAWALLLLLHPAGDGTQIYADLDGDGTRMLIVHVGMVIFIPLMAAAVYLLLRGLETTAATVSRIALLVFVGFYTAWEALQGIATGILVDKVSALPAAETETGVRLIQDFAESPLARDFGIFAAVGGIALVIATIAAGLALRDAGAPRWTPIAFGIAGFLIQAHPPPFGPTGLVIFAIAVILLVRGAPASDARLSVAGRSVP